MNFITQNELTELFHPTHIDFINTHLLINPKDTALVIVNDFIDKVHSSHDVSISAAKRIAVFFIWSMHVSYGVTGSDPEIQQPLTTETLIHDASNIALIDTALSRGEFVSFVPYNTSAWGICSYKQYSAVCNKLRDANVVAYEESQDKLVGNANVHDVQKMLNSLVNSEKADASRWVTPPTINQPLIDLVISKLDNRVLQYHKETIAPRIGIDLTSLIGGLGIMLHDDGDSMDDVCELVVNILIQTAVQARIIELGKLPDIGLTNEVVQYTINDRLFRTSKNIKDWGVVDVASAS